MILTQEDRRAELDALRDRLDAPRDSRDYDEADSALHLFDITNPIGAKPNAEA